MGLNQARRNVTTNVKMHLNAVKKLHRPNASVGARRSPVVPVADRVALPAVGESVLKERPTRLSSSIREEVANTMRRLANIRTNLNPL